MKKFGELVNLKSGMPLMCFTGCTPLSPTHVVSSCCIPSLGNLEREVFKANVPTVELELMGVYRALLLISILFNPMEDPEEVLISKAFNKINICTSSKSVVSLLRNHNKCRNVSETTHRILIELERVLNHGIYNTAVNITYIPKKVNLVYKKLEDIPFANKRYINKLFGDESNQNNRRKI